MAWRVLVKAVPPRQTTVPVCGRVGEREMQMVVSSHHKNEPTFTSNIVLLVPEWGLRPGTEPHLHIFSFGHVPVVRERSYTYIYGY